jgi:hypothetical protein
VYTQQPRRPVVGHDETLLPATRLHSAVLLLGFLKT